MSSLVRAFSTSLRRRIATPTPTPTLERGATISGMGGSVGAEATRTHSAPTAGVLYSYADSSSPPSPATNSHDGPMILGGLTTPPQHPLIVHGKLAAAEESRFESLVKALGTLSAPGVRVEVYDGA